MSRAPLAGALLAALLVGGAAASARAGAPAWLKSEAARAAAAPRKADALVLLSRTESEVTSALHVRTREIRAIRVLTPKGLDAADFAFPVGTGMQLVSIHAWTMAANGLRDEAGRDKAAEAAMGAEITDSHLVLLRAPGAQVGDVVGVECVLEGTLPFATLHWVPQGGPWPIDRAEYALTLPHDWAVDAFSTGLAFEEAKANGATREWRARPWAGLAQEPDSPPLAVVLPTAVLQLRPAAAPPRRWSDIAGWVDRQCAPRVAPGAWSDELFARVRGLTGLAEIEALSREVQRSIRYEAIELGMQGWIPRPAAETWSRRYGDCKDKATVMVAALRALGVEARPALACTNHQRPVHPEFADAYQFNHMIVAMRWPQEPPPPRATVATARGDRWTLFDPTDPSTPIGELPFALGGTRVLVADSAGDLLQLPDATPSRGALRARLRLAGGERDTLDGVLTCEGPLGRELAWTLAHGAAEQGATAIATLLQRGDARPTLRVLSWDADSMRGTVVVRLGLRAGEWSQRAGDGWLLTPPWTLRRRSPPPADTTRTLPFALGGPIALEDELRIEMPYGGEVESPDSVAYSGAYGGYEITTRKASEQLVTLRRRYEVTSPTAPPEGRREVADLWRAAFGGDGAAWRIRRP